MTTKEVLLGLVPMLLLELRLDILDVDAEADRDGQVADDVGDTDPKGEWNFLLNGLQMIHISFLIAVGTNDKYQASCFARLIRQRLHNDILTKDPIAEELAVRNNISLTNSGHGHKQG